MQLTAEQKAIIESSGDIKINAVAGSGKTTTVIEYAKARPKNSKILYLAFNKSVKLEATRKFEEKGLTNVKVETAHSLAYKHIVFQNRYKVKAASYKTNEIAELLQLQNHGEKLAEYIVANHINKYISYFCNSDKQKVQDLNYLDTITDPKAKAFVSKFYDYILKHTRLLLGKMNNGDIEITHDFYLKKFQLSNPQLPYDYILFDEGQDASMAMLDVFLHQKATKVIVGDTHQQIYGWRHAVNSLDKAGFKTFNLSTSFRFSQDIADLAMEVLKYKRHLNLNHHISISGAGKSKELKSKAILARTNLGLLLHAIEYITENKKVKKIYFEGNINSYTYAEDGASLYDVLNLYNYNHHLVRDPLMKTMKDIDELEEYIEKTEDNQLSVMVEIVKEYGNEIPEILKSIKAKHVENDEKNKAQMIFSTVHRCKGMEYDSVQIVQDFLSENKLEKLAADKKELPPQIPKLNEEINLLYVAITRAKNSLQIPDTLMPKDFPDSPKIIVTKVFKKEKDETDIDRSLKSFDKKSKKKEKSFTKVIDRKPLLVTNLPWNDDSDDQLTEMFCEGYSLQEMAKKLGRTKGSVMERIKNLDLEDIYGY